MGILGIASGTDWESYIAALVEAEKGRLDTLTEQRNKLESNRSIMTMINEQFTSLNTTLSALRFESTYLTRLANSSNAGRVSATANVGAETGSYNIEITQLAKASQATSGLGGALYNKIANLSNSQTMGITSLIPYDDFQGTRALSSTLIKDTMQAGQNGAAITAGDSITITGNLKDGTAVTGTFTFAGNENDTLQRLAMTIAQTFEGEIAASVGTNGELIFIETDPSVAGDVTFNTTIPPLDLQFNDNDYSGSTLDFGIGNILAGAGSTARRLVSNFAFTSSGSLELSDATDLATLDQVTGTLNNGDIIRITGTESGGGSITSTDFTYTGAAGGQTIADLITEISGAFTTATASYENGRIVLTDNTTGTSSITIDLEFVDQGSSTEFELGDFSVAEVGRDDSAQMITTSSFTVEGTGEHRLSSTDGKAGKLRGNLTLPDPSNTLESFGVSEFSMLSIDPDGTAGPLGPVTITGLNEYSTIQDLVDAINEQVPTVTAQLYDNGSSYYFEIVGNAGGQDIRVYDDTDGILQILGAGNPTDLDTAAGDPFTTAATTDDDDVTIVDWFTPDNGGPRQRRVWSGDEGSVIDGLIGGVGINAVDFNDEGVATVVTTNSAELNTQQEMYSYVFGARDIVTTTPAHYPPFDAAMTLAEAGFATTPENSADNPTNHTDGVFSINGVQITVGDVNTITVNELLGTINSSGAGVTATFDESTGRFILRANSRGVEEIDIGATNDTSNFLTIAGLLAETGATEIAGEDEESIDMDLPLSEAGFSESLVSGVFTINDVKITIDVGVDSMDDIIDKINNSGAGVTASYDSVSDSFTLVQDLDEDATRTQIEIGDADDTSNFLEVVALTADTSVATRIGNTRQQSKFTVNGNSYTRDTNSVDDIVEDVTFKLNALTNGPETVTIEADTDKLQDAIIDFVVEFNTTMELVNGKPLSSSEKEKTAELTDEMAENMTLDEMEEYLVTRDELLIREFVSGDSTVRQITQRLINSIQGLVSNSGTFGSLSQIGLATAEVGAGVDAAAVSLSRLMAPTSDRDALTEYIEGNADLQKAIADSAEDLYLLFANVMDSTYIHQGTIDLNGGITVNDELRFTISDGENTANITFNAGTYTQSQILTKLNQSLLSADLSSKLLAYFDFNNQLNLQVTNSDNEQAFVQLTDYSRGADSLVEILGLNQGVFFGPDPRESGGVALRTREFINDITSTGGLVLERLKSNGTFDRQIAVYDDAIEREEAYLTDYEERLRDKFARLETTLSDLQSEQASIEAAIAQWIGSTSDN